MKQKYPWVYSLHTSNALPPPSISCCSYHTTPTTCEKKHRAPPRLYQDICMMIRSAPPPVDSLPTYSPPPESLATPPKAPVCDSVRWIPHIIDYTMQQSSFRAGVGGGGVGGEIGRPLTAAALPDTCRPPLVDILCTTFPQIPRMMPRVSCHVTRLALDRGLFAWYV